METDMGKQSFWEHLDVLRATIVKIVAVAVVFGAVAFCFKEQLFAVVLAPKDEAFVTYGLFNRISVWMGNTVDPFSVQLISTGLAQQFVIHVKMAFCAGVFGTSPYILYQLFRFVSPALYENERRYALQVVGGGYVMFGLGVTVCYLLVFPFTFRFLGTYQVSEEVVNLITLDSYVSTLLVMCLVMGLIFEIPVLSWLFAKLGLLSAGFMRRYRKHAVVLILVAAAVITPTSDVFTLLLVALPMWLLYEASIWLINSVR